MNPCEGICSSNARYNLPFVIHHFQAILDNQIVFFDLVHIFSIDSHKKIDMEKALSYTMLNVVACDGLNGVEQLKTYWEHDSCTKHARFT